MRKVLLFILILGPIFLFSKCSKDIDPFVWKNPAISVYTKSSALELANSGGRKSRGDDWVWDEDLFIKVNGVKCKIKGISLNGDLGDPGSPSEVTTPGSWKLFSDSTVIFDLDSLQEIVSTKNSVIEAFGELNVMRFDLIYIEFSVVFKNAESKLRFYWSDDNETGAKKFDLLIKDSISFKWFNPYSKKLLNTRPVEDDSVVSMYVHPSELESLQGSKFILDHHDNLDYLNNPLPWSYDNAGIVLGQPEIFYTINNGTSGKTLRITIDLSFVNSVSFNNIRGRGKESLGGIDSTNVNRFVFYVDNYGEEIYDLDSNSISSPNFDIYDLLPGFVYPDIGLHITVIEEEE